MVGCVERVGDLGTQSKQKVSVLCKVRKIGEVKRKPWKACVQGWLSLMCWEMQDTVEGSAANTKKLEGLQRTEAVNNSITIAKLCS